MTTPDPFPEEAIRDWLEALKSRSESPEIIALQRQLLDLLYRAARQLPEVQALVKAARAVFEDDGVDDLDFSTCEALQEALKHFDAND